MGMILNPYRYATATPASFPTTDLLVRYEAKDEAGYTSGDTLTSVVDQTATFDLTGVTGTPTWQDSVIGGQAAYSFDGTEKATGGGATVTGWDFSSSLTVAVVCASDSESGSRVWPFALSEATATIVGFTEGETASEWGIFFRSTAGTDKIFTSGVDTTVWTKMMIHWDGSTVTFFRDGLSVGTATRGGSCDGLDRVDMGDYLAGFTGDVALAAVWESALSASDRTDFWDYVNDTYGV